MGKGVSRSAELKGNVEIHARVELAGEAEGGSDTAHDIGDEGVEIGVGGILLAESLEGGKGSASVRGPSEGGRRPSGGYHKEPRCPSRKRDRQSR